MEQEQLNSEEIKKMLTHAVILGQNNIDQNGEYIGYGVEVTVKSVMDFFEPTLSAFDELIQQNQKWAALEKISPAPEKWLEMYEAYSTMLTQEDVAGWWQEQFYIADKERNELKQQNQQLIERVKFLELNIRMLENKLNDPQPF